MMAIDEASGQVYIPDQHRSSSGRWHLAKDDGDEAADRASPPSLPASFLQPSLCGADTCNDANCENRNAHGNCWGLRKQSLLPFVPHPCQCVHIYLGGGQQRRRTLRQRLRLTPGRELRQLLHLVSSHRVLRSKKERPAPLKPSPTFPGDIKLPANRLSVTADDLFLDLR